MVDYYIAESLEDASEALVDEESIALAGGQAVVLLMNTGFLSPGRLVSLKRLADLKHIRVSAGAIEIGALVTHAQVVESIRGQCCDSWSERRFPFDWQSARSQSGHPGRQPGARGPHPRSSGSAGSARARAHIWRRGVIRDLPVTEIASFYDTTLAAGEVITHVVVPAPVAGTRRFAYIKHSTTTAEDYPAISVAAVVELDRTGAIEQARLAFGAAGPTVVTGEHLTTALIGSRGEFDCVGTVQTVVRESMNPYSDRRGSADYKRELAALLAADAMKACLDYPILADGEVMFVGQRIAAVVVIDARTARWAADLVVVEYERLPAVLNPHSALTADAAVVHPRYGDYPGAKQDRPHPNVQGTIKFQVGSAAWAECDQIVEGSYRFDRITRVHWSRRVASSMCTMVSSRSGRRTSSRTPCERPWPR